MAAPVAGAIQLRWFVFLLYSGAGSLLWILVGTGLGVAFHAQVGRVFGWLEEMGGVALPLVVAVLAAYVALKWWQRRKLFKMLRMARIGVDELWRLMQDGARPVVVDVRSGIARKLEPRGIPGALPLDMEAIAVQISHLPTDREIILYCTCPNEESAAHVARQLIHLGYKRVRPLQGGLDAWVDAGYELEDLRAPAFDAPSD